MRSLKTGDLVFIPGTDSAFLPGRVAGSANGDTIEVSLDSVLDGSVRTCHVALADIRLRFAREDRSTSQDNTSLVHLNDATILENLCARHRQDQIYTYTASVLLAVNPYKQIEGLYSEEQCARYSGKHIGALPPHPYAIADTAYRAMTRERRNQGLLISGESGAGKTETAKIVMQYLSYASSATSDLAARIQARVLQAQPILESFGNAVTMRNSNSSRFGKYNRVFFSEAGTLVDAGITTYLLESSRVVVHGERERTYHCFYEMLAGLSKTRLQEMQLQNSGCHRLISGGHLVSGLEQRDERNFARLREALQTVGLDETAIDAMMEVLAGLIHLGDIPKDEDGSPVEVDSDDDETKTVDVNEESVDAAARLLGMDPKELGGTLKRRKVSVPGRNSIHEVPRTESQLRQALHSLIKALYKRLFERTVQRINDSFGELRPCSGAQAQSGDQSNWRHISILDIYGFERLQRNSFEQLCINLANERLQQYFVENVLVAEQSLYKREGLPWKTLNLPDSEPVINCITQVFRTLDEYSQQLAKGVGTASDEKFCQKILDEAAKCQQRREILKQLKMSGKRRSVQGPAAYEAFVIRHYAGGVEYNTRGWLDKNNDRLLAECEALICDSSSPLVRSLAEEDQGKAPFRSIGKKYNADLEALLKMLGACDLHYIRCFKPNEEQKPNMFDSQLVLDQIVQCGTIELVRIMHDGFPNRCFFEEIAVRFRDLLPQSFQRYGRRTFIEALMLAFEVPKDEWELGTSRLFLKAGQIRALEEMRSEGARPTAKSLAQIVGSMVRKRWVRAGHAVRLCNFVPRFIAQIRERRRLARHRLLRHFHLVRFFVREWIRIRQRRMEFLARALCLGVILYVRVRPRLIAACQRARDAVARRHEEERQRELERLREEERQRKELEEQQRRQLEEERRLRQLEEERKLEEERRLRQLEEERKLEEQQRQRQQLEAERQRRQLEEERQCKINFQYEEQQKQLEEERRLAILAQASPQHTKSLSVGEPLFLPTDEDQTAHNLGALAAPGFEDEPPLEDSSSTGAMSQSAILAQQEIATQMDERIRALEKEMARKQEEVMQQMRYLQEKNESLERSLEEERAQKEAVAAALSHGCSWQDRGSGSDADPLQSPQERRRKASLIPLDEDMPSPSTPLNASVKKSFHARSARSYSLISSIDLGSTSRRTSTASKPGCSGRDRHLSLAQEALSTMRDDTERTHRLGDAPGGEEDLRSQRRWWAEQRRFLLDDLYPVQSATQGSGGSATRAGRATGGSLCVQPARPPAVAEESRQGGLQDAPAVAAATAPKGGGSEVRNLCMMFEHAEEAIREEPALHRAPNGEQHGQAEHPVQESDRQGSRLKQPQYFRNRRRSIGHC